MKKVNKPVWVADDGTEFTDEEACKQHEALMAEDEIVNQFIDSLHTEGKYADRTIVTIRNAVERYVIFRTALVQHLEIEQEQAA